MRAGTNDPASDAAQASRDHTSLFRQRLRHILAEQPDSRKGGRPRWAALLLPAYILRWIANTLLRRRGLKTVELELEEATGQYATIFPEPVVHVKGFVKGMNFDEGSRNEELLMAMCTNIARMCQGGGTLVWDGDSYNRDSFTIAVLLVTSVCPNITLAAFSREGEKDRVIRSWKQRLEDAGVLRAVFVTCATGISYTELGLLTLRATRSKTVLCLGGGGYLLEEYTRCCEESPEVVFMLHPATRTVAGAEEQCSLISVADAGLKRGNLVIVPN